MSKISRRDFLKVSGVSALGVCALGGVAACSPAPQSGGSDTKKEPAAAGSQDITIDYTHDNHPFVFEGVSLSDAEAMEVVECDYLVIGSGVCGLTTAARAAELGNKVIVLEKAESDGGATSYTEAHFALDTCKYVKEQGHVTWTLQEAYDYFMHFNNYRPDGMLVSSFLHHCNEPYDWFIDRGAKVNMLLYSLAGPQTGAGMFFDGKAAALAEICRTVMNENGAEIRTSCPATNLVMTEDGGVAGAIAAPKDGEKTFFKAKAVFVATGGFGRNKDMVHYYMGAKGDAAYAGDTQLEHDGDGINMMLGVGAIDGGLEWSQGQTPNVAGGVPYGDPIDRAASEPYIWVNTFGKRVGCESFTNLTIPFNFAAYAPGSCYFNVFDADMVKRMETENFFCQSRGLPYTFDPEPGMGAALDKGAEDGTCFKADSLKELAEMAGIEPDALEKTIGEYNALCEKGEDDVFFKKPEMLLPVKTAPFYAIKCIPSRLSSLCGVKVNEDLQVTDANGKPISGLYAGGLDSGGFFATDYNHAFSGSASSFSYFAGFHGADAASEYIKSLA